MNERGLRTRMIKVKSALFGLSNFFSVQVAVKRVLTDAEDFPFGHFVLRENFVDDPLADRGLAAGRAAGHADQERPPGLAAQRAARRRVGQDSVGRGPQWRAVEVGAGPSGELMHRRLLIHRQSR